MSTVFIIHGSGDGSQEHWFPWMKKELEKLGHTVIAPQFPCKDVKSILSESLYLIESETYV